MDVGCGKVGCAKKAAKNKKYCSRGHAPYGHLINDDPTVSERMVKYGSERDGEPYRRSSIYAMRTERPAPFESNTPPIKKIAPEKNLGTVGTILKAHLPYVHDTKSEGTTPEASHGENSMQETNSPKSSLVAQTGTLSPPPTPFEEARLESMNLIDESAKHLRDLMKSVTEKNSAGISAACNCASQIHKLIRLKLDIARAYAQKT